LVHSSLAGRSALKRDRVTNKLTS